MTHKPSPFVSIFAALAAFWVLAVASGPAAAGPLILASSEIGSCTILGSQATITLNGTTFGFFGSSLVFTFTPVPSGTPIVRAGQSSNPEVFNLPPGTYHLTITSGSSGSPQYTVTVPVCPSFGELGVSKTVINTTGFNTTNTVFPVTVTCLPGPTATLNLSNGNGYSGGVSHIPAGGLCTIHEAPVPAPAGCHWITTYPRGPSIQIMAYRSYLLTVQNQLVCPSRCPSGTTEQVFPGTTIRYCCNGTLNAKSHAFCCTRELLLYKPEGSSDEIQ